MRGVFRGRKSLKQFEFSRQKFIYISTVRSSLRSQCCKEVTFFHFRWNSLRAGHVSIRAQEKTSPHILVLETHATPTPALFMQKTPQKCQEKNLPRERNTHFLFSRERNTHFLFPRERNTHFPSLGKFFSGEVHFLTHFLAFEGCSKHSLAVRIPAKMKESTILDRRRISPLEVVSCSDKSVSSGGL